MTTDEHSLDLDSEVLLQMARFALLGSEGKLRINFLEEGDPKWLWKDVTIPF